MPRSIGVVVSDHITLGVVTENQMKGGVVRYPVENGGARSEFRIEIEQNLHAIAPENEGFCPPERHFFKQGVKGKSAFIDPPAWPSRRVLSA